MTDLNRYNQHLSDKEKEWEARCTLCGACCGALEDPCENLRKTSSGKYFCSVYDRRFGKWRTVSGKEFECVPIREKLNKGESWLGDEHCGYKKYLFFMKKFLDWLDRIDYRIADWMYRHGRLFLRISLGIVFIWFGALKIYGLSPANDLIAKTVYWFPPEKFIPVLGWWEVAIGAGLLIRPLIRLAILLLFLQMPGTMLPLFFCRMCASPNSRSGSPSKDNTSSRTWSW